MNCPPGRPTSLSGRNRHRDSLPESPHVNAVHQPAFRSGRCSLHICRGTEEGHDLGAPQGVPSWRWSYKEEKHTPVFLESSPGPEVLAACIGISVLVWASSKSSQLWHGRQPFSNTILELDAEPADPSFGDRT